MIACLSYARLDDRVLVAQALFGAAHRQSQLGQVAAALVAQLDPLETLMEPSVVDEIQQGGNSSTWAGFCSAARR
jgi:hypothetical protein